MSDKKLILVIGATGAQGLAVIDALLAPSADGTASPYAVRALTRDPASARAQALTAKGVECVTGTFENEEQVLAALQGVYGAYVNTDGFTVGEARELFAGMRIFELAKEARTVKHYVWSSLDYVTKKSNYSPAHKVGHYNGKARVAEFLKAQPSEENGMVWSAVTSGPYMEMLNIMTLGPLRIRPDGTRVFASPVGDGHIPLVALTDIGFFARYSFDHRAEVSGRDLEIASELIGWDDVVETFKRVTGKKAVYKRQTVDEWFNNFQMTDVIPVANDNKGPGSVSWKTNFSAWFRLYRDDIIKRDMDWIRSVNPKGQTLEGWMRETGYQGELGTGLLKNQEDHGNLPVNWEQVNNL